MLFIVCKCSSSTDIMSPIILFDLPWHRPRTKAKQKQNTKLEMESERKEKLLSVAIFTLEEISVEIR